jgi:hypothetical protein
MSSTRPFVVIVPGGSQNPAHYAYLTHLLLLSGYPVFSAPLPSVGATGNVTVADEAEFIRNKMLLPVLDIEERNVVLLMHSYSSVPGSVAASGLGIGERAAQGVCCCAACERRRWEGSRGSVWRSVSAAC